MKLLLSILAFVLALPVIILIGIALGPVALLGVFVALCALPALLFQRAWLRRTRGPTVPPPAR